MPEKPETLADALANARTVLAEESWIDEITLLDEDGEPDDYAQKVVRKSDMEEAIDRIEAAAERERNAHTNDIHDALYKATGIPGNAAALRKALERIVGWCEGCHADACEKVCRPELTSESIHAALAALAAPARNCDRFKTEVEAMEEWNKYPQSRYKGCRVCPHGDASMVSPAHLTLAEWLFVTAEGKEAGHV